MKGFNGTIQWFCLLCFCLLSLISKGNCTQITARQLGLYMSQASYCEEERLENWDCYTCDESVSLFRIIEQHGEKAIIGLYENTMIVSFRGSSNILNWIDNVQFSLSCPYNNPSICVETGFYKVFEYMKNDIYEALYSLIRTHGLKSPKLLIGGHSLGAAVATLMTYDILNTMEAMELTQELNVRYIELVTFGSPRVGNEAFVYDFMETTKNPHLRTFERVTHAYDIVPHLPQQFLGYDHIPHEIWYNEENTVTTSCDDEYDYEEDPQCSNSCGPLHCTSISDHLNYMNISMGSDGDC